MTSTSTAPAPTPLLPALQIGRHTIESPVVLAPMAGITNRAFRRLCREYGREGLEAGGASGATSLYVSEMITSRALVERTPESMRLIEHDPDESPALHPALRRGPGHRRGGRADAGHRGPRRPHRPQLRLPRAEGDAQGRRRGAALEARPVRGHRHRCGPRGRPAGRAGHRQDAQGHRRRAPHLPRGRAHRRAGRGGGSGAARADSRAGVLRAGGLERHRPAEGDRSERPGPGQR